MKGNQSRVTEFILLVLTDDPEVSTVLFMVFLMIYSFSLLGNLTIMPLMKFNSQLHTPMYLFLNHLSLSDTDFSYLVTPNMLVNLMPEKKTISLPACAAQYFTGATFGGSECFLLAVMAYDRYAVNCKPLIYMVIMSEKKCAGLVVLSYLTSIINALMYTNWVVCLWFCGPNELNYFCCDSSALLKLSCSDTHLAKIFPSISSRAMVTITTVIIVISYLYRYHSKNPHHRGKVQILLTCSSHLLTIMLYFGIVTFIYVNPSSNYSMDQNKVVSVFYVVVIPKLNLLIYSLRNKEIMDTLRRMVVKGSFS
ncbi:olfactory receptor 472-like [Tachyglossus aculeatus]|uniref:olfactory receptor 472-like n=1 Tax=Tachyglossus aculeatus TaxID=9261 RepID=UPI0018F725C2|nr:olfactory receptor 472-like [Tachyglossus aculeatus]